MSIIKLMDFKQWFWGKFEEWRKGTTKGPTAFARYLGISQPLVSAWLNGDYQPSIKGIKQIAETYPDIYDVLNIDNPTQDDAQEAALLGSLPSELAGNLRSALTEINRIYAERGIAADSTEAVQVASEVLEKFGFIVKENE